jgi:hypothetical protein
LSPYHLFSQEIYQHVPATPAPDRFYLFYLHGAIIESRGIRPTHPEYGIYEYEKILHTFADSHFVVISEARKAGTRIPEYARKVSLQVDSLLKAGVPPHHITISGASKGGAIAVMASHFINHRQVRYVIIAICNEQMALFWEKNHIQLSGQVLYMVDEADRIAGSCKKYRDLLKGSNLMNFKEITLRLGLGHGVLYRPLKEWVQPAIRWARSGQ